MSVLYKYLLLMRPRSPQACPPDIFAWKDYDSRKIVPQMGIRAWGEVYYQRELTDAEVRKYELIECGPVDLDDMTSGHIVERALRAWRKRGT